MTIPADNFSLGRHSQVGPLDLEPVRRGTKETSDFALGALLMLAVAFIAFGYAAIIIPVMP